MAELKFTKEGLRYYIGIKDKDKEEKIEVPSSENVAGSVYDKFDLSVDQARKNYQKISEAYKKNPSPKNYRELEQMWFMVGQSMYKDELDKGAIKEARKKNSILGRATRTAGVILLAPLKAQAAAAKSLITTPLAILAPLSKVRIAWRRWAIALDYYWEDVFLNPDKEASFKDSWGKAAGVYYSERDSFTYPFRLIRSLLTKEAVKECFRLEKKYHRLPPAIKHAYINWKVMQFADRQSGGQKAKEWAYKYRNQIDFLWVNSADPLLLVGAGETKLFSGVPVLGSLLKGLDPFIWVKSVKGLGLGAKIGTRLPAFERKFKGIVNYKPIRYIKNVFTRKIPTEARVGQLPTGNKLMQNFSEMGVVLKDNFQVGKKVITKLFKKFSEKELNQVANALDSFDIISVKTGKIISKDYAKIAKLYNKKIAYGAVKARKITIEGWKPGTPFRRKYWSHKFEAEGREIVEHFKTPPTTWRKARTGGKIIPKADVINRLTWIKTREPRNEILTRLFRQTDDLIKGIVKGDIVTPDAPKKAIKGLQEMKDWLVAPALKDISKTPLAKIPKFKEVKGITKKAGVSILKLNDLAIRVQKRVQLTYRPAWYFKNFVDTAIFKNLLADVPFNKLFKMKLFKGYKGQTVNFKGVMARELMDLIDTNKISRGLGKLANWAEDLGRQPLGQHFLETTYKAGLKKGMIPKEAWRKAIKFAWDKVRHFHFNYNELSAFDNIMKRYDPYWVYHSRNALVLATQFLRRPALMGKIVQAQEAGYKQIKKLYYSKLKAARAGIQIGRFLFEPMQWFSFNDLAKIIDPETLSKALDKAPSNIARGFTILTGFGIPPSTLLELCLENTPLMEQRAYKTLLPQLEALNAFASGILGKPINFKHLALEKLETIMPEKVSKQWDWIKKQLVPGKADPMDFLVKIEMSKQKMREDPQNRKLAEKKVSLDLTFQGLMGFFFGIYPRLNEPEDVAYRKTMKDLYKDQDYIKIDPTPELLKKTKEVYPDLNEHQQLYLAQRIVAEKSPKEERKRKAEIIKKNPWLQDRWSAAKPEEMLKVQESLNKARATYDNIKLTMGDFLAKKWLADTNEGRFLEQTWGVAKTPVEAKEATAFEKLQYESKERKAEGNPMLWSEVPKDIQEQITANPDLKWAKDTLKYSEIYQKATSLKFTEKQIAEWGNEIKELEIKKEKLSPTFTPSIEREIKELTKKQLKRKWDFEKYEKLSKHDKDKLIEENEEWKSGYEGYQAHKLMYETVEEKGKKPKEVLRLLRLEKLTPKDRAFVIKYYRDEKSWDIVQDYYKDKVWSIIKNNPYVTAKDKEGKPHYERYNLLTGKLKEYADKEMSFLRKSYFDIKIQKAIRNPVTGKIDFDKYEKLPPEARAAAIKRVPKIEEWYKRHKEAKQAKKQHDWYVAWKQFGFKETRLKRLAKENPALYKRLKLSIPEVGEIPIRTATSRIMKIQKEYKYSGSSLAMALNNEPEQAEKIFKKYEYMEKLVEYNKKTKKWVAKKQPKRVYGVRRRIEVGPPKEVTRQAALISSIEKSWSYGIAKAARAGESAARSAAYGGNKALESFERKRKARLIPSLPEEKKVYIPKPLKPSPIEKATKERIRKARRSERLIKLLGPSGFSRSRYGRAKAILDK